MRTERERSKDRKRKERKERERERCRVKARERIKERERLKETERDRRIKADGLLVESWDPTVHIDKVWSGFIMYPEGRHILTTVFTDSTVCFNSSPTY